MHEQVVEGKLLEGRGFGLFGSRLVLECIKQCLTHSRHSINTCGKNPGYSQAGRPAGIVLEVALDQCLLP